MAEKRDLLRWPSWMPKPQRSGYKFNTVDRRQKTDMEVGSLYRVQFDTDECTCDCTVVLNRVQSAWFESFEQNMLHQGARWFEIPLMSGGKIVMHTARFKTRPTLSEPGPVFSTYNFTLDIDKRPQEICPQMTAFITCVSPQELCQSAELARQAMQEVIPSFDIPCPPMAEFLRWFPEDELNPAAILCCQTMQEVIPSFDFPEGFLTRQNQEAA